MDHNKLKRAFSLSSDEVLSVASSDPDEGLSDKESRKRIRQFGQNLLEENDRRSVIRLFIDQLKSAVSYLLMVAAILSLVFGDLPEGIAIIIVLIINAIIGFVMEYKAQKSIESLKKMDKIEAAVIRSGTKRLIDAEELVPGDLVEISEGKMVPADLRLIYEAELHVNEASLTGESVPVEKSIKTVAEDTRLPDRANMVYKGTAVTKGKGRAIVVGTGMDTEIGNISRMVHDSEKEEIPLNKKLDVLSQKLIWLILGLAAVMAGTGYLTSQGLYDMIQISIAWSIAAIPEGLPVVASIALARGMLRLADKNVLVKRLGSVETLGETNMILTDKTGTLTENKLTVSKILVTDQPFDVDWQDGQVHIRNMDDKEELVKRMVEISTLCDDARFDPNKEEENDGDPLEIGLLRFSHAFAEDGYREMRNKKKVAEDPFDSESKMMGAVYENENGYFLAVKGATEALLSLSVTSLDGGDIDEHTRSVWQKRNDELASEGYRVLAFGYQKLKEKPKGDDFLPDQNIVFAGLIGFIDPPRKEVKSAIEACRKAGIEVVMVTGDHPGTARAVADQITLSENKTPVNINGSELESAGADEISEARIFSRVDPAQKLKILEAFQEDGKIVGMTGDGVNDAPALKKANIGIAMGQRGTQVAKEVADMILKDDMFNSILAAIKEGRIIFGNIRKFIIYQLSYHLSEILVIATVNFILFRLVLYPLQLLFLNILLDVFPALALGLGRGRNHVMTEQPKDPNEPLIGKKHWFKIIVYGVIIAAGVCGVYFYSHHQLGFTAAKSNGIAFFTLAFAQLFHVFDMIDADEELFRNQVTTNKYVWMAIGFCVIVLFGAYFIPGVRELLSLEQLGWKAWSLVAAGSLFPIACIQIINKTQFINTIGFRDR